MHARQKHSAWVLIVSLMMATMTSHVRAADNAALTAVVAASATGAPSQAPAQNPAPAPAAKPGQIPRVELDPAAEFLRQRLKAFKKNPTDPNLLYSLLMLVTIIEFGNTAKFVLPPWQGTIDNLEARREFKDAYEAKLELLEKMSGDFEVKESQLKDMAAEVEKLNAQIKDARTEIANLPASDAASLAKRAQAQLRLVDLIKLRDAKQASHESLKQFLETGGSPATVLRHLRGLQESEAEMKGQLAELDRLTTAADGTKNANVREAIEHFDAGGWTARAEQWLKTEEGKKFKRTAAGKLWSQGYDAIQNQVRSKVQSAIKTYEKTRLASPHPDQLPKLHATSGNHPDAFSLERPNHVMTPIQRKALEGHVQTMCNNMMASLASDASYYSKRSSLLHAYRWPLIHGSLTAAGFTGLYQFEEWFQAENGVPIDEARQMTIAQDQLAAKAKSELRGQLDAEKKKPENRLKPFFDVTLAKLRANKGQIKDQLKALLTPEERALKLESKIDELGHALEDNVDLTETMEQNFLKVFEKFTLLEDVIGTLKSNDDVAIRRHIVSMYRESVQAIFSGVSDPNKMDRLEKTEFFQTMVTETHDSLKAAFTAAAAPAIPGAPPQKTVSTPITDALNGSMDQLDRIDPAQLSAIAVK